MLGRAPWLCAAAVLACLGCTEAAKAKPAPSAHGAAVLPASAPAAAAAATAPRAAAASAPSTIPEIDALVARALADHRAPGCVVAIGRKAGVSFGRAYGERQLVPSPASMTEDTIFDLASLTKPIVTASLVMILAERGKLKLDERAARYLPELDRASTRMITVRQLLLHSAGLGSENSMRDYMRGHEAAIAALLAQHPVTPPGEFSYSDVGYLWLGELVARIAQQPLDLFARSALFEPLGMRDTGFNPDPSLLPRIAPTEVTDDRGQPQALIHGVVHDPRAYRLGGVAGNAGLFSTAGDLARFARMLLGEGELDGVRVMSRASVREMTRPVRLGEDVRTLGWDMHSRYSRLRGTRMSERAFGHGGFTGTSLWVDPGQDLFVIVLSNRVHPDGKGNVIGLAGAIADAAVAFMQRAASHPAARVLTGIDVLREQGFERLRGKRIGLLTHDAARAADGESTLAILARAPEVKLAAVFSPEHGFDARHEGDVRDGWERGVRIHSLYGPVKRPTPAMLDGLDVLVVDLVDVGTRFYTYMSTLHELLNAAAERRLPVLVLDRPNPLGGAAVEGPVLDPAQRSFVNYYSLPVRHGMTAGELASLIDTEEQLGVALDVIEARGFCRELLFQDTGLAWVDPSPNLRSPEAALLYPAIGLLESANLSVGRGTDRPFQHFGAPYIDSQALLAAVEHAHLPGVRFRSASFTPSRDRYAGQLCHGLELEVEDARAFLPVRTGLTIAVALRRLHPTEFTAEKLIELIGNARTERALLGGEDVSALEATFRDDLARFLDRRRPFLRYPSCTQP